jgi:O-antigen/teichoic acid export membrane protein
MYTDYDELLRATETENASNRGRLARITDALRRYLFAGASRTGNAGFSIGARVTTVALIYVSDIILARWMGQSEFGTYVYVWTCLLLLSDLLPLGLAAAAERFIPEYTRHKMFQHLRGIISGSRWLIFLAGSLVSLSCASVIQTYPSWFDRAAIIPLYLACAALPFFALSNMLDAIARASGVDRLTPLPLSIVRPLLFVLLIIEASAFGAPADAVTAMTAAVAAIWATTIIELLLLDRQLAPILGEGGKCIDLRGWLRVSFPIVFVWGFYTLLTYTDILLLQLFQPKEDVALYYAASKTLALVALIYVAVDAAIAHRFRDRSLSDDPADLVRFMRDASQWTFWPSAAGVVVVLILGIPLLWLFGSDFTAGYPLLIVLAVGLLARAWIGPAERLLTMLGSERTCGVIYAAAFAANVGACLLLIPAIGAVGAALGTTMALITESALLFFVMRRRLGVPLFGDAFRMPRLDSLTRGDQ